MNGYRSLPPIAATLVALCAGSLAQEARITVRAGDVTHRLTRHMTGACIEDVNHECYGGIYSQMLFGESFQEPAAAPAFQGFATYGGSWMAVEGILAAESEPGPKLIADHPPFSAGEVGVEIFLPNASAGVAGLICKVNEPRTGMDTFIGYEVALDSQRQVLVLGRHRNNWEPIQDVPCEVPIGRWISLAVRMAERSMEVLVDGKSIAAYEDTDHPLATGRIGLRPFNRACRYRNLWVKTEGRTTAIPFTAAPRWDDGVSGMWRGLRRGSATGSFAIETRDPFVGVQSQAIVFAEGGGAFGIENRGLNRWGLSFVEGKPYEGYLWVRAAAATPVSVALESVDGARTYATARLDVAGGDWRRLDFTLTPGATDTTGRFAIAIAQPGAVTIGHAYLAPGPWGRFKGLPVRKDVAEGLIAQGLTVLRYGGSMVNSPEYRWKKMVGPRDRRPPYRGTWYPYSSNGWGIIDFLDFCDAAGFLAIPAFNMDETPGDMAIFVDYVNGPAESPWRAKREVDGHPRPYRLTHIELGNEEAVNENYVRRFKPMAEAIWAKDPAIVIVVGDFLYNGRIENPMDFPGSPVIRSLAAHREILEFAKAKGRPVWFDCHVWNDEPRDPDELGGGIIGLRDYIAALGKLAPGADYRVCVFEENAGNHAVRRALGHAHAINELERMGAMVPIVCAANCLQPYRQNDNGWDQGMLFLTPSQVWGQPPYYVTQIISRNYLPWCVAAEVQSPGDALDVTAKRSEDRATLTIQVVNLADRPVATRITIDGFAPRKPVATAFELAGKLDDVNTPEEPERIKTVEREWRHAFEGGVAAYTFPPHSFTLLRLE